MKNENLSKVHNSALVAIEKNERNYRLLFFLILFLELLFFAGFILLADFKNRIHLLLFISSISIYTIMVIGLTLVALYIKKTALKIITAIENTSSNNKEQA